VAIHIVIVGIGCKTAIAAKVAISSEGGAVNKLLLGEAEELASGDEVGTFEGAGRAEGPA